MKIAVVGTGYVGLVAGTCFAESGNTVICVDVDAKKVAMLNDGKIPIYEPGLEELVHKNVEEQRLSFTTDIDAAVKNSLVVFIAVGTPPDEDGSADLKHVLAAARSIGKAMNGYKIVVDKSTVPVGTAQKVAAAIAENTSHPFNVVSNPEFLKEGAAIDDFMKPDRVVIGTDDPRVAEIMKELYAPFVRSGNPIIIMDIASAELTKYAANAMLATRISFMNEIAQICDRVGANVTKIREGIGYDSRIGMPFLYAGCGYGGSCFPKDTRAIISTAKVHGYDFQIMRAVEEVNANQKKWLFSTAHRFFKGDLKGKKFAIWGLAFKPRTDDVREASALILINELLKAGATVHAHDPEAIHTTKREIGDKVSYHEHMYEALPGADALFVVTEWNEFRNPDFDKMKSLMKSAVIFDGRNLYNPSTLGPLGYKYYRIGAPGVP
ncbi:MAG: UDP-glucose/GDP-mannose dehydrogenase family protein [Planctomycetes bacterium]|nr:UDP-glucose/GDP-mannose dehydrogenase family protein [Planctomycetota bacterium]MCC7171614.1 UDP-glucose/GDP-mannose dehydrogenase family protein [Planctomycetota bacterium]